MGGIDRGADDYVAKPFHYPEVLARLSSLIRRSRGATMSEEIRVGTITVDRHSRRATIGGRSLDLSAKDCCIKIKLRFRVEVIALAPEFGIVADGKCDIKIAVGATVNSFAAVACYFNRLPVFNACASRSMIATSSRRAISSMSGS